MATTSQAKNAMLQGLKEHKVNDDATFRLQATGTIGGGGSNNPQATATYGSPSSGEMDITAAVVISIPAGSTISSIRVVKGPSALQQQQQMASKSLGSSEVFTYAGTITVTSAKFKIVDA